MPSGFFSATEVTNTTTASGTTMNAMVRNCRLMYAMAPSWMNPAISCWASLPGSAASTPLHQRIGHDERHDADHEGDDEEGGVAAGQVEDLVATFRREHVEHGVGSLTRES